MWLLNFLPDSFLKYIVLGIVIVGAVSFALGLITRWVPFMSRYALAARAFGLVLLIPGMYLWGGYGVEMEYRAQIKAMEERIAIAEEKSKQENIKIVKEIEIKTEIIKQDTDETLYLIEQMKKQINANCQITPEIIDIYNQGVTGETPLSDDVIKKYNDSVKGGNQ